MKIIGIVGKAGSGKSTFARMLGETWRPGPNGSTMILPFAAKLKSIALKMGWDGKKDKKGRKLLQLLGTECGRDCIGEGVWLRHWIKVASEYMQDDSLILIDDVRFQNEVDFLVLLGGEIIAIEGRRDEKVDSSHASEKELTLPMSTWTVNNGSEVTLEFLQDTAVHYLGVNNG